MYNMRRFPLFLGTYFMKFNFAGHSIAHGDFKAVFIFLLSRMFLKYSDLKYSRVTYQKTRIGSLNSNIESIFINVGYWLIGKRKTVLFYIYIFQISQPFYFLCSQFSRLSKWFDIWGQYFICHLSHDYIIKSIFLNFTISYRELKTLKREYSRKLRLRAIKCPPNRNFQIKSRTFMYISWLCCSFPFIVA